jgi:hypothetical protein
VADRPHRAVKWWRGIRNTSAYRETEIPQARVELRRGGMDEQAGFSFLVTILVHCIVLPLASTRCVEGTLADVQRLAVNLQRRSNISPPRNVPV